MSYSERTTILLVTVLLAACTGGAGSDIIGLPDDAVEEIRACEADDGCVTENTCLVGSCLDGICVFEAVDGLCDDGNLCTADDSCVEGKCEGTPLDCDDDAFCNGEESCDAATGECVAGTPPELADDVECTVDECDEDNDEITHTPEHALCEDGDQCTAGLCDPEKGCSYQQHTASCDDGDPCTVDDSCLEGLCAGDSKDCGDGEFCNGDEVCEVETGECVEGEALDLDDGLACTTDACDEDADEITHTPDDAFCDDENPCTVDLCSAEDGCGYENNQDPCDDGEECTDGDLCAMGICEPGEWTCFEDCSNEVDDDKDDLADCADPDCLWELVCLPVGETCVTAFPLNLGEPMGLDDVVEFAASTVGKLNDHGGSCSAESEVAPETVHLLELSEPVGLAISLAFEGGAWPAIYVLDEECSEELFCDAVQNKSTLDTVAVLPAGTYHIVVDGNFVSGGVGDESDYTLKLTTFTPGDTETGCANGIDDDADGKIDCLDEDCAAFPTCVVVQGESCGDAVELFDTPVTDDGTTWEAGYAGTTAGMMSDLSGSCDVDTVIAPDMVFTFALEDPMWLDATHDFKGVLYPALYVLGGACGEEDELACEKAFDGAAAISMPVAAGSWFLVVDGSYGDDAGEFTLAVTLSPLDPLEGDCANGLDDDMDGLLDCADDDCEDDVYCVGFPGDNCNQALGINDGKPIGEEASGISFVYEDTTAGLIDHYSADCAPGSKGSPDGVYFLNLKEPMTVSVKCDFAGNLWPAVYILGEGCMQDDVLACATGFSAEASINVTLPQGKYFIIVDASFEGDAGDYVLTVDFAQPPSYELECDNGKDDDMDGFADCADDDCENEIVCQDPYESNDSLSAAFDLGPVWVEGLQTEEGTMLFPEGDEDWFRFSVDEPGFLTVVVAPADTLDVKLFLYGSEGAQVASSDSGFNGGQESLEHPAVEPGIFYVAVKGFQNTTGTYQLSIDLAPPADLESECADGKDEDLDGAIDCDDDDCSISAMCGAGDTCEAPLLVNDGLAVGVDLDGAQLTYAGSTVNYEDDSAGSCSEASGQAPDAFWKLTLSATMEVRAFIKFEGFKYPALYVLKDDCAGQEVACAASDDAELNIEEVFAAGDYYFIVDGNWVSDASPYTLTFMFESPITNETNCSDGVDDDNDNLLDCYDDDCFLDEACRGEKCELPYLVNDGTPVTTLDDGLELLYEGTTVGMIPDYSGSCSPVSADNADAVWMFELQETMKVNVEHDFSQFAYPALYVFKDSCDGEEIGCATEEGDGAVFEALLEPGIYFAIVDADFPFDEEEYALLFSFNLPVEDDCFNGLDEDNDGLVDCLDDDCIEVDGCQAESCLTAFPMNEGVPVTQADAGITLVYPGATIGMASDHAGSCEEDTADAPDAVYVFELQDPMRVTISHDFEGTLYYPALYLFAGSCGEDDEVACATATSGAAVLESIFLEPGTYFVVVDASFATDEQAFILELFFEAIPETETNCANGLDDDADGFLDCCDGDCVGDGACVEVHCGDGIDDDCDEFIDCDDDDCVQSAFCAVQSLPFAEDFEYEGEWPDGWETAGPDEECAWEAVAAGVKDSPHSMKFHYGSCHETESYQLLSPWLDVAECEEISVTFTQKGAFVSFTIWHGLGMDDAETESVQELGEATGDWLADGPYTFDVTLVDNVHVFFGYHGNNADDWWVDDVLVECSKGVGPPVEANCNDELDNDEDELIDCADDDCQLSPHCVDSDDDGVMDADDICPLGDDAIDDNQNQLPDACEIDWAGNASPNAGSEFGQVIDIDVYVEVQLLGVTDGEGQGEGIEVTLLYKTASALEYSEMAMEYSAGAAAADQYMATIPAVETVADEILTVDFEIRYVPPGTEGIEYLYEDKALDGKDNPAPFEYSIVSD